MHRRHLTAAALAAALLAAWPAAAQDTVKIGLILPMTGPSASTGREIEAAAKLYLQQNGATVAGKTIELIVRDDTGTADVTKRLAQELVVNDKVAVLAGFGLTPLALASAPIATQAKVPQMVMAAATAVITEASPFIVRTSFTLPQATVPLADWAAEERHQEAWSRWSATTAPASTREKAFAERFGKAGGEVVEQLQVPLKNPDFAPFLQRVRRRQAGRGVRLRARPASAPCS